MPLIPGFGFSYKPPNPVATQTTADIPWFNSIGKPPIRCNAAQTSNPWTVGSAGFNVSNSRIVCQTLLAAGFNVDYGFSGISGQGSFGGGGLTLTLFNQYCTAVLAECDYLIAQGITPSRFSLGNELEGSIDGSTITIATLNAGLRTLAANIKAKTGWVALITYNVTNHSVGGVFPYTDWIANGLGVIDIISIHEYGSINVTAQTVDLTTVQTAISAMCTAFPGQVVIGEFNLDSNGDRIAALNIATATSAMQSFITYIQSYNIPTFLLYTFEESAGNTPSEYGFSMLRPDGTMSPLWPLFFSSRVTNYTSRGASISRSATPNRAVIPSRSVTPTRNLIFS